MVEGALMASDLDLGECKDWSLFHKEQKRKTVSPYWLLAVLLLIVGWSVFGCSTKQDVPLCDKPRAENVQDDYGRRGIFFPADEAKKLALMLQALEFGKCRVVKGERA